MSLPVWCHDTVTVQRAPLVDDRGSRVRDWAHADAWQVEGCSVQPSAMPAQPGDREGQRSEEWSLWLPMDADILDTDRVLFDGRTFTIVDGIRPWRDPFGRLDHLQATIRRWEG